MKNPTTLQKTRDLECSKFGLTEEQYLTLYSRLAEYDRDRLEYFQDVKFSDAEADILRTAPREYLNINGSNEIQMCADLFNSLVEYDEQIYFAEHDDDPIQELGIDIETYSSVDLTETGVYPYAEADDFEILLFAYSVNGSPVRVVDLASGESIPPRIKDALTDKNVLKTAYNAAFERVCLSKYLGVWLDPEDWDCTMVRAARLALPLSLGQCALVLGLAEKKMTEGKALINFFSKPCKPTIRNGQRTRNLPEHAPDKWLVFKKYNKRDVEVEQAIRRKVTRLDITDTERAAWLLDQRINDRGVLVDMQLANRASTMDDEYRANLVEEAKRITGLENPNSVTQLKEWLKTETGLVFPACDKETVKAMLPRMTSVKAKRVLQIRQELGKTSTAKYKAMLKCACKDNRVRGLFQFYGANRTGRFAGRLLQLQNLPQNHLPDLDDARNLVKYGDLDEVEMMYGNVPQTLSELIRTAFIAKDGCTYHVCDFSAIEARVIAWLAGEDWVLDVFRKGGDIYCATASQMFHVPVEKHGRNANLRQKGKIATLACIAEGELVLTDKGLVPIEKVTTQHLLWDGEEWVHHEGVIFKGYKEVITYEGLTATKDHIVYIHEKGQYKQIQFGLAAAYGSHLIQTGNGRSNIRLGDNYITREEMDARMEDNSKKVRVYDVRNAGKHHRFTVSGKLVHNCGYGGGVNALVAMGADKMGLSEREMDEIIKGWRNANPRIVRLWKHCEQAARYVINTRESTFIEKNIKFEYKWGGVCITLPSKRQLFYPRMHINGNDRLEFEGMNQEKKTWGRIETYSGRITENLVQAIARGCLVETMLRLDAAGYKIVFHIHDETVVEATPDQKLEDIAAIFGEEISWAKGLPLKGAGYTTPYYLKD